MQGSAACIGDRSMRRESRAPLSMLLHLQMVENALTAAFTLLLLGLMGRRYGGLYRCHCPRLYWRPQPLERRLLRHKLPCCPQSNLNDGSRTHRRACCRPARQSWSGPARGGQGAQAAGAEQRCRAADPRRALRVHHPARGGVRRVRRHAAGAGGGGGSAGFGPGGQQRGCSSEGVPGVL